MTIKKIRTWRENISFRHKRHLREISLVSVIVRENNIRLTDEYLNSLCIQRSKARNKELGANSQSFSDIFSLFKILSALVQDKQNSNTFYCKASFGAPKICKLTLAVLTGVILLIHYMRHYIFIAFSWCYWLKPLELLAIIFLIGLPMKSQARTHIFKPPKNDSRTKPDLLLPCPCRLAFSTWCVLFGNYTKINSSRGESNWRDRNACPSTQKSSNNQICLDFFFFLCLLVPVHFPLLSILNIKVKQRDRW